MHSREKRRWKKRVVVPAVICLLILSSGIAFHFITVIRPPEIADRSADTLRVIQPDSSFSKCGRGWLKKMPEGLWVLYLEGSAYERGVTAGKLTKDLLDIQEEAFIGRIRELVPSGFYLRFLRYFIYWFNRDLDRYIPEEYLEEIYGISLSASPRFSFIGAEYRRMLNYHSAHDIGHALQNMHMVGCTSFGVWNGLSADSSLLIGRNFDFYAGDRFAENRIVCFVKPDEGIPFMMVTWAGMTGAVSGMNVKGLTVTLNAAKSSVPSRARTPISLLAREILQYAGSVDEAVRIAGRTETFVSESLLIGSATDGKAVIIEKSPRKTALFDPGMEYIICSNHFQGKTFANDTETHEDLREMVSVYRYRKVLQDINEKEPLDERAVAEILRDRTGMNGTDIGMGNEKAVNQLICHHSVIFRPGSLQAWVSAGPWQLGPYVCFDMSLIFSTFAVPETDPGRRTGLDIPGDEFLGSDGYSDFLQFKSDRKLILERITEGRISDPDERILERMIASNPSSYEGYSLAGDYHRVMGRPGLASVYYRLALEREVPRTSEKEQIVKKLTGCLFKTNKKSR